MANITGQVATVAGYQDGTTNWSASGNLYVWNNTGGTLNTVGVTFDASALDAGDTITACTVSMQWGSDTDVNGTYQWRISFEDAANPTVFSGSRLPRSVTLTTNNATDSVASNPSGSYTSPDLSAVLQELVDSYGAGSIGNLNVVIEAVTNNDDYVSWDGNSNFTLDVTVSTGSTGTLSETLDNFTSAASGQVGIDGSLSETLDNFTSSAAGQIAIVGSLNETLDDFTSSAGGGVTITGTLSETLDNFTSAASGGVTATGTLSETLDNFTSAAAGFTGTSGTLNETMEDFTSNAAGVGGGVLQSDVFQDILSNVLKPVLRAII